MQLPILRTRLLFFFSPSRSKAKTVHSSALFLVYRVLCVKPPSVLCVTPLHVRVTNVGDGTHETKVIISVRRLLLCDESVRNLSTNILRRLFGDYKFAYISNQLRKVNGICKVGSVFKLSVQYALPGLDILFAIEASEKISHGIGGLRSEEREVFVRPMLCSQSPNLEMGSEMSHQMWDGI
ncbi:hypothetical protein TNCV_3808161 [Trichonephila clavipes]|nr:hypothetical protein TNCV_3808161 [Trichonephila clavipes]